MSLRPFPYCFFIYLLTASFCSLASAVSGIEGHDVSPVFTPAESLFTLSFVPGVRPARGGIPGYPEPRPYALLGLGAYTAKDSWTYGGRAEGRLFFLSGTAKGLAVRRMDFGPASENDFSVKGGAFYRPTGEASFTARFRGIEANDELGGTRRTANAFILGIREADRKGALTVQGSWTEIYLDAPEHANLKSFKLTREGERLFGFGDKPGRVREAWMIAEEQGGSAYRERLLGRAFLAAGIGFGNRMFLEAGLRASGYSALSTREASAYPFLSFHAAHPRGYSVALTCEPEVSLPGFEERYLYDPYLLVNPEAGYTRSPIRFLESVGYVSTSANWEIRLVQEHLSVFWVPQDSRPGFLALAPCSDVWRYSWRTRASSGLGKMLRVNFEASGYRANQRIPYDPELQAAGVLALGYGTDSLRVRLEYVGKRFRAGRESLRGYPLAGVSFEKQIYPWISAAFSADNLGDNRYELISGRLHRGRSLALSLSCRL